jgi:signal transduction histidine kinase
LTRQPLLLALVIAVAGAAGTLAVATAVGMRGGELAHLALLMLPSAVITALAAAGLRRFLVRAPVAAVLVAVAVIAVLVAVANLAVLGALMFVDPHDAVMVGVLLAYAAASGVAAALVVARSTTRAVGRLADTARLLGDGDLRARVGALGAGEELQTLARALDDTARRLEVSLAREHEAENRRRDLVTAVSHDLRTPLAGLRAMVEAIQDEVVTDPPTLRRYIGEMQSSVASLVRLVDELFEFVQLDTAEIELEARHAALEDVVESAASACHAQAAEKGLIVETRLGEAAAVPCSPRLTRVLQNLLQNAIRHTPADGTVRIEANFLSSGVQVVVADQGDGIPIEAIDKIFEPFWRGDTTRSTEGAGLGLAIAKRIVESLGGRIGVESEPRTGTRFAIELPI